jgi:chloramphenicol-sensitive protein RarD
MNARHLADETSGILYAGGTYVLWGFVPLYWALLADVPPVEITLHRILWGALFATAVTAARGRLKQVASILRAREMFVALAISSLLIAANWTLYIWCVSTHQLVEASLGYYLTPLVSMALGVLMLGERISRPRMAATGLAAVAVVAQTVELGRFSLIAPGIALSFGFYGYMRKRTPVDSLDGLTVETLLLCPISLAALGYLALQGTGAFVAHQTLRDALLIGAGPVTAIPLVMFAAGARRIRMTTLGFLQYLAPSITLIVATTLMGESFTRVDAITFGCVWSALVLVGIEGQVARLRVRLSTSMTSSGVDAT